MATDQLAELKEVFAQIDRNSSGSISVNEIKTLVGQNSETKWDTETLDYVFEKLTELDVNGDGQIDFVEFQRLLEGKSTDRLPYFSKDEVALHNVQSDCWVSFFGKVYDLTPLVNEHRGSLVQPILRFSGKDITHWFDARNRQPKTYVHPELCVSVPFCPYGRYVHIPPPRPSASWSTNIGLPWWNDSKYCVGNLSARKRKLRIVNQLTSTEHLLEVCTEETINEIQERYLRYNQHAKSYTWKRLGRPLNMRKTLDENGILDESEEFALMGMEDAYIPAVHVCFNDDLSVA
jgi:hypothetical protein